MNRDDERTLIRLTAFLLAKAKVGQPVAVTVTDLREAKREESAYYARRRLERQRMFRL